MAPEPGISFPASRRWRNVSGAHLGLPYCVWFKCSAMSDVSARMTCSTAVRVPCVLKLLFKCSNFQRGETEAWNYLYDIALFCLPLLSRQKPFYGLRFSARRHCWARCISWFIQGFAFASMHILLWMEFGTTSPFAECKTLHYEWQQVW